MAVKPNTSSQVSTSDLPLLTMEDIILNSEIVLEYPEEGTNFDHNLSFPTLESSFVSLTNVFENTIDNQEPVHNISSNLLYENSTVVMNAKNDTNLFDENTEVAINNNYNDTDLFNKNNEVEINLELEAGQITADRSPTSNKNKWKKEINKKNRMNGQQYFGYKRDGKNVTFPTEKRPPRKIKEMCSSKKCLSSKNRFCNDFDETRRLEIFNKFWSASWEEKNCL